MFEIIFTKDKIVSDQNKRSDLDRCTDLKISDRLVRRDFNFTSKIPFMFRGNKLILRCRFSVF